MLKGYFKIKKRYLKPAVLLFILIIAAVTVFTVFAEPGDGDDPVVSLSYIQNKVIPELKAYVDSKLSGISSGGAYTEAPKNSVFEVVELEEDDELICGKGAELILRMGSAEIIATEKGGLADTTAGYDLSNGISMPANHLLIVPVDDGRGIKANSDVLVMVKGEYSIK